jgi:hypothetical protein
MIRTYLPSGQFRWISRPVRAAECESRTFQVFILRFARSSGHPSSGPSPSLIVFKRMRLFKKYIEHARDCFVPAVEAGWHPNCYTLQYGFSEGSTGPSGERFSVLTSGGATVIKSRYFCPFLVAVAVGRRPGGGRGGEICGDEFRNIGQVMKTRLF